MILWQNAKMGASRGKEGDSMSQKAVGYPKGRAAGIQEKRRLFPLFVLTFGKSLIYNKNSQGERRSDHASDISAEKTASQDGTWFPQENGNRQWPEGAGSTQGQGKETTHLLKKATVVWLFFIGRVRLPIVLPFRFLYRMKRKTPDGPDLAASPWAKGRKEKSG